MQLPVQVPEPLHTNGQLLVVDHTPVTVQVCTFIAEHCVVPGVHAAAHAPPEHTAEQSM
jgi:hypothetical protein